MTKQKTLYLNNNEEREEGGTPAIIESIRLGLVFKLKDSLNHEVVTAQEHKFARWLIKKYFANKCKKCIFFNKIKGKE